MISLSKDDKLGIFIITICVSLFLGIGFYVIKLKSNENVIDELTLCSINTPISAHTVFFVDRTDPLNESQTKWLFDEINLVKDNLSTNELLSIFPITGDSDNFLEPIFSLCSPRTGKDANPLYENQSRIEKKFNKLFGIPLQEKLEALKKGEKYNSSPIMEALRNLSERPGFSSKIKFRKIIIASDMLQNGPDFSHYRAYTFSKFLDSPYFKNVETDLTGVSVKVFYLASNNPKTRKLQGAKHREFWKSYFERANSTEFSLQTILITS